MTAYALAKLAHVMIAVLAMGLVTASAILARASSGVSPSALRPLVRIAMVGILLMLASGSLLDYLLAGALHAAKWFRIGMGWTVAAGVVLAYALRVTARAKIEKLAPESVRRRLLVASWIALVCIAATAVVMVRKP